MKNGIRATLLWLTLLAIFTSCKNPSISYDTFAINEETVKTDIHEVTISGTFSFTGEVTGMKLNISHDELMAEAENYPMEVENQSFSATADNLDAGTHYYYCIVIEFGPHHKKITDIKDFNTLYPNTFSINVSCNPSEGGHAEGGGIFETGTEHSVIATPNPHYDFKNWTENNMSVSTSAEYTFIVDRNRTLVANFSIKKYSIVATVQPAEGGNIEGAEEYDYGHTCTLIATANAGFIFEKWTENGIEIPNSQPNYEFTVSESRTLVAHFKAMSSVPEGAINGLYSINPTSQVYFSSGNLQYKASTNTWQFAINQWDRIGKDNENIAPNYNGWIDLFGWGTGDTPTQYSIEDTYYNEFHEWGNNPISNGGNSAGLWRTLTSGEWEYVFFSRQASTINGTPNARFAKAIVNNVKGIILFPDDYSHPTEIALQYINQVESDFFNNYSGTLWKKMEDNGCVFLPVTGHRKGSEFNSNTTDQGYYWSSSTSTDVESTRKSVWFSKDRIMIDLGTFSYLGESVRLVRD